MRRQPDVSEFHLARLLNGQVDVGAGSYFSKNKFRRMSGGSENANICLRLHRHSWGFHVDNKKAPPAPLKYCLVPVKRRVLAMQPSQGSQNGKNNGDLY